MPVNYPAHLICTVTADCKSFEHTFNFMYKFAIFNKVKCQDLEIKPIDTMSWSYIVKMIYM